MSARCPHCQRPIELAAPAERLVTLREAAEQLGESYWSLRRACLRGELAHERGSRDAFVVLISDARGWLERPVTPKRVEPDDDDHELIEPDAFDDMIANGTLREVADG